VFSYFKDTIWNQFTTNDFKHLYCGVVCLVISKIQSGINSQQQLMQCVSHPECV